MGYRHRATRPCPGRQGGFNGEPLGDKSRLRCRAGNGISRHRLRGQGRCEDWHHPRCSLRPCADAGDQGRRDRPHPSESDHCGRRSRGGTRLAALAEFNASIHRGTRTLKGPAPPTNGRMPHALSDHLVGTGEQYRRDFETFTSVSRRRHRCRAPAT